KSCSRVRNLHFRTAISSLTCLDSIVAVHGFGGDSYQSWTSGKPGGQERCVWLRELLPNLIPSARIRTFSYSSTANHVADTLHPEALTLTSKALLRAILSARKEVRLLPTLPT